MLTQYDIDKLKDRIQKGETPTLYYVADFDESRENNNLDATYKSDRKYKVVEVRIRDIHNAYYDYLDYINHKDNYHEETETEYYDYMEDHAFTNRYIVKNTSGKFDKDLNPRIPSIIYGRKKVLNYYNPVRFIMENEQYNFVVKLHNMESRNSSFTEINDLDKTISIRVDNTNWETLYKDIDITFNDCDQTDIEGNITRSAYFTTIEKDRFNEEDSTYPVKVMCYNHLVLDSEGNPTLNTVDTYTLKVNKVDKKEYVTESPVSEVIYTNDIKYGDYIGVTLQEKLDSGDLDWKYMRLENKEVVDGIEFQYLTTEWFYLETINYPTVEYPLINTTDKKCSYFLTLADAWNFINECEA